MIGIFIYIDGEPYGIELFKDEAVQITSSIQNFRDLGKIFTDYSKQFTVPASAHNNQIFKHWYNSEVGETDLSNLSNVIGAFDHRVSYYGYIEVDGQFFRNGKFLLKGAEKKNNKIESYTVNFVGNLVQLKDRFKQDKLKDLSIIDAGVRINLFDQLNHSWDLTTVKDRVISDAYDVLYPIIGAKRKFYLNSGTPSQDISHASGQLKFNEIFPALRVSKIIEYIQEAYGITFDGAFIQSQTFSKLFLYLKNQEELVIKSQQIQVDFTTKQDYTEVLSNHTSPLDSSNRSAYKFDDLDLTTNVLTFDTDDAPYFFPYAGFQKTWRRRKLVLKVNTASSNPYNIYVYNNGQLYTSFLNKTGNTVNEVFPSTGYGGNFSNPNNLVYNFTFFISSDNGITFTTEVEQSINIASLQAYSGIYGTISVPNQIQILRATSASQTTTSNIDIKSFVPDITVESFITGLIKMFNLMVIPTSETSFYLQTLNDYYNDGIEWDLTKYIDPQKISIEPPKLYKKVEFKYQKSDNLLNGAFRGLFNREYGDLNFENANSAFQDTYTVELPFEDFMFERETGNDFMTATILNSDLQPYVSKPSLIYCNGVQSVSPSIRIADNSSHYTITDYVRFSNELPLASTDLTYTQSLNWGAEISAWDLNINFTGLYEKFYSTYIENLFNQRARVVKVSAQLPTSVLCFIKLRDKIILQNKRFLINTMAPEINSGKTDFELILDNNQITTDNTPTVLRMSNISTLNVDNTAQTIELQFYLKDNDLWRSKIAVGFLLGTYTSGGNKYSDGLMTVSIPANTTGSARQDAILVEYYKGSDSFTHEIPVLQDA